MATTFDSQFASAGFPILLSQFGESIVYAPLAGGERPIEAIIEREPPAIFDVAGNAVLPKAILRVTNSCRSGVASNEIDTGSDEFEFVLNVGEVIPKRFSVLRVISQDSGVLQVAVA